MNGVHAIPASQGRHDRLIQERIHDPYKSKLKLPDHTVCPDCMAVFSAGRWQWLEKIKPSGDFTRCPACSRIHEKVPAGMLTLSGDFFQGHRDEILNLLHNKVNAEKAMHPLKRLMDLEEQADGSMLATFTDTHLPRDVGQALAHAYHGELDIQYAEGEGLTRVKWSR